GALGIVPDPTVAPRIEVAANGVVNAASYSGAAVAPGEMIAIFGSGLGSAAPAPLQWEPTGYPPLSWGGTQVLFDGIPAPLLYVQAGQVGAIVPYAVSGKSATVLTVSYQGQSSAPISVPVAAAAPGIVTTDSSGRGQGAIRNQDGSANSPGNPAPAGSIVVVYATGEGQTKPAGVDGKPADAVAPRPILPVTSTVGATDAEVKYA